MNNKIFRFILVISLVLNFSMLLSAGYSYYKQSKYGTPLFCSQPSRGGYLIDSVSLSPEQRKVVEAKALAFHSEIDVLRGNIISKRIELVSMLRSDSPDPEAIRSKIAEIGKLQGQIQSMVAGHMLEVKGLLDEDQQNKLFDMIQEAMKPKGQSREIW
jgi:Spy/CpxP family protein refolding chaperone